MNDAVRVFIGSSVDKQSSPRGSHQHSRTRDILPPLGAIYTSIQQGEIFLPGSKSNYRVMIFLFSLHSLRANPRKTEMAAEP
jgi:hypothetical protein